MARPIHFLKTAQVLKSLSMVCFAATLSACTHVYTVQVDALRTPERAPRRTYHLVPEAGRDATDPTYVEASAMVHRVLESNALFAASRPEWADMVIELDFGVSQKKWITVNDNSGRDPATGSIYLPDRDGAPLAESTGIQVPASSLKRVVAVWDKHLTLVARENTATAGSLVHAGAELWRVDVSVQDTTSSIEELIPVLTSALMDSIDRDTGLRASKRISDAAAKASIVSQAY